MFLRNRQSVFFSLFIPVILMSIFGAVDFTQVEKIKVGVVEDAPSQATVQFVDALKKISAFEVIMNSSEQDERAALTKGERALVLIVPNDFIPVPSGPVEMPSPKTLRVLTNAGQEQQVQTGLSILTQMLDNTTLTLSRTPKLFELVTEKINAHNLRYIDFLLPGILAMAIMQMSVFSVAFLFVDYKEKGILKRLIATPMKPSQFVTANVIVRLVVALAQVAVLIGMGVLLFKVQVVGSYWLLTLISIIGGIMFLSLGFVISGIARTVEAVPALANLIVFPMLFLSGVFFPIESLPSWLQNITQYLPLSYFANALREVMVNGAGWQTIQTDLAWMLGWAVALVVLSNITFSFEEKRGGN